MKISFIYNKGGKDMPTYIYYAEYSGAKVTGKVEAKNREEAVKKLSKEGYTKIEIVGSNEQIAPKPWWKKLLKK